MNLYNLGAQTALEQLGLTKAAARDWDATDIVLVPLTGFGTGTSVGRHRAAKGDQFTGAMKGLGADILGGLGGTVIGGTLGGIPGASLGSLVARHALPPALLHDYHADELASKANSR